MNKKLKDARKQLSQKEGIVLNSRGDVAITAKVDSEAEIFSQFDFDSNEKLNDEFASYIWDKASVAPVKSEVSIKIFTTTNLKQEEVADAIHNKFKQDYLQIKAEKKSNLWFSFAMLVLGLLFLGLLFLSYSYFKNAYADAILEIVAWVFTWEAVDAFFLQRAHLRKQQLILLKLYVANVEIKKIKPKKVKV